MDEQVIVRTLRRILSEHGIEDDQGFERAPLASLPVDSFAWVTVLIAMERELSIVIPDDAVEGAASVSDIIAAVTPSEPQRRQEHDELREG